jgi:hypothetical protein
MVVLTCSRGFGGDVAILDCVQNPQKSGSSCLNDMLPAAVPSTSCLSPLSGPLLRNCREWRSMLRCHDVISIRVFTTHLFQPLALHVHDALYSHHDIVQFG